MLSLWPKCLNMSCAVPVQLGKQRNPRVSVAAQAISVTLVIRESRGPKKSAYPYITFSKYAMNFTAKSYCAKTAKAAVLYQSVPYLASLDFSLAPRSIFHAER